MTLLPGHDEHVGMLRQELANLETRVEGLQAASADVDLHEAVARIAARCDAIVEVSDLVYEDLSARLQRLEAELVEVRALVAPAAPAAVGSPAAHSTHYGDLVHRVRELVLQLTPPGATVAVVGKGDPALVDLAGRAGWHFPRQGDGTYLGFHPRDDASAVSLLQETVLAGAGYLVFPATSLWWLRHYPGLRQHLEEHHVVVVHDATTCAVFRLRGGGAPSAHAPAAPTAARQVRDLVDRLLPGDEQVALVSLDVAGYQPWARTVLPVLPVDDSDGRDAVLDRLRSEGVRYLVIPHLGAQRRPAVNLWLEGAVETVIDQRQVCAVLEITDHLPTGARRPPSQGA